MEDKICKNCKYYKPFKINKNSEYYTNRGDCKCKKYLYDGWGIEKNKEYKSLDTLRYWDYECYQAGFNVGENFGCIHFVKKEKK
jgi:hypothetical protein